MWAVIALALGLTVSLGASALTDAGRSLPGRGAERFVAADGTSITLVRDGKASGQIETALYRGAAVFTNAKPVFLWAAGGLDKAKDRTWLVERRVDPEGGTLERLMELSDRGLTVVGEQSGTKYSVREPALIVVPANPRAGQTWQQSGTTRTPSGSTGESWSVRGSVEAKPGDCLQFTLVEERGGTSQTRKETRCPRLGVTETSSGVRSDGPVNPPTAPDPEPAAWAPNTGTEPRVFQPMQAGAAIVVTTVGGVAVTRQGSVVHSMVSDDLLYVPDPASDAPVKQGVPQAQVGWVRHPGGSVRSLQAFGDVVIAGTTLKRLTAYDSSGWRLWTLTTPDVADHIVRVSPTRFAVQTTTGTLQVRDIASGALVWQAELGIGAPAPPSVGGERDELLVTAVGDLVEARSVNDGRVLWQRQLTDDTDVVVAGSDTVVTGDSTGHLFGLAVADGSLTWRRLKAGDTFRRGAALSSRAGGPRDRVVIGTDLSAMLVDADSGRIITTVAGETKALAPAGPGQVLVAHGATYRLYGADGPVAEGKLGAAVTFNPANVRSDGATVLLADSRLYLWGRP